MGSFCLWAGGKLLFCYPGNMKATDPSFIGKRGRMREKYMTKKNVRGKTKE